MHVVVIANQKGGSGKTTLARNLAVADGNAVLIDRDPQGSLTSWWNRRATDEPPLVTLQGSLADTLAALDRAGVDLVVIDTPPAVSPLLAETIGHADLVLIPVRPTPDDLDAVGPILDMVETAGRSFVFVLSQVKARTRLASDAVAALAQHGRVAPVYLHDRVDFPTAAIFGQAVTETPSATAADREVRGLLQYVRTQLSKAAKR